MIKDIIEIIISSAESSFFGVVVFVGSILIIFSYFDYKKPGMLINAIEKSKKIQPVLGALLGLTPGCGGAILVIPLFFKGSVSFGAVIAALIATMGDSAFVIMSTMPLHYLIISTILFFTSIAVGYIVDYYKLGDPLLSNFRKKRLTVDEVEKLHNHAEHTTQLIVSNGEPIHHIGHVEGDEFDLLLHHQSKRHEKFGTLRYKFTHGWYYGYWFILFIGLILGILQLLQVDTSNFLFHSFGRIIGVSGIVFSVMLMISSNKFIEAETHEEAELKRLSLKETLIHSAEETSFIGTWVFIAFLVTSLVIFGMGYGSSIEGELVLKNFLSSAGPGIASVILGALIGLIPGCGPQIIFVALYTRGMIPFSALLANAISQDGDALFPMLIMDLRSSLWASVITTIPALILGMIFYFLEVSI